VRVLAAVTLASVSLACPVGVVEASIFDLHGFGARGAGVANALTAVADDYTATYYNPAGLTVRKRAHYGLGVSWILPGLSVDTDLAEPDPAPRPPEMNVGLHMGVLVPIGGKVGNRLAVGLGIFHPALQFTRVEAFDPARPQFYLYQSLPDKLLVAPAVAFELDPRLSIGVGLQILAFLEGTADASVSLENRRFRRRALSVDLIGAAAPTAGLLYRPTDTLRIGLCYRKDLDFSYSLPVDLQIEDVGTLVLDIRGTVLYTPHQLSLGAAQSSADGSTTVMAGLTWAMWSMAPDPSAQVDVVLHGEDDTEAPPLEVHSAPVDLGADDILISRIGAEHRLSERMTVRGGYSYRPSPLPLPTGRTNYVDSPAHTGAAGLTWRTGGSGPDEAMPISWELTAQVTWLTARRVDKSDPTDSVGSYTAGGPITHLAVSMTHEL